MLMRIATSSTFELLIYLRTSPLTYRNSWKGIEDLHKELQKFIKGCGGEGQEEIIGPTTRSTRTANPQRAGRR